MAKATVSPQTAEEALKVAKGTARPGQTKEQTKLIAQGIEKGIAEYKKREKAKARERDKVRKKQLKEKQLNQPDTSDIQSPKPAFPWLPWSLLALSWIGFITAWFGLK